MVCSKLVGKEVIVFTFSVLRIAYYRMPRVFHVAANLVFAARFDGDFEE